MVTIDLASNCLFILWLIPFLSLRQSKVAASQDRHIASMEMRLTGELGVAEKLWKNLWTFLLAFGSTNGVMRPIQAN